MKTCPKCNKSYDDESLNFCLDDGEWLKEDETGSEDHTRDLPLPDVSSEADTKLKLADTDETAILPTGAIELPKGKASRRTSPLVLAGIAVGLVAVVAAVYAVMTWYGGGTDPEQGSTSIEAERLTGDGNVEEAAISPDGKFLAYVEIRGNEESLRVKQIETNSTVEVLKAENLKDFGSVEFSPDGNFIFFGAVDTNKKSSVYKIPTLGGSLAAVPIVAVNFSLSPDGDRIAYYRENAETSETEIVVANIDGSAANTIAKGAGKKWVEGGTAWSPDGTHLLIIEGDDDRVPGPLLSLAVYSFSDGSLTSLGPGRWEFIHPRGVKWAPSGKFVYVSGKQLAGTASRIWRVSVPDGLVDELTNNENDFLGISLSADGKRLIAVDQETRSGIWVSPDLDPEKAEEIVPARGKTWGMDWTVDGKIVFISDRSGTAEVWIMDPDGTNQKQLSNDRLPKREPSVSPDGRTVVYASPVEGQMIYKVPIGGGTPVQLETGQIGPDSPVFTGDGKSILFTAWPDGKQSIFSVPQEGGRAERLTDYFSSYPSPSPDGSVIACFFLAPNEKFYSLGIIPANGGKPVKIFDVPLATSPSWGVDWTPDGKQIIYVVSEGERKHLWGQPVVGGDPVLLSELGRPWIMRRAFSLDGKRIAIQRGEVLQNAVMLKLVQ